MKTVTRYECETCEREYETALEAINCEARGFTPKFKVGDIVSLYHNYGWFNGQAEWIVNKTPEVESRLMRRGVCPNRNSNCFGDCCNYTFYWVITFIDHDEREEDCHRPRYHVQTL